MSTRPDAIIVGAGIVGTACAYYLSAAGIRTLILDRSFAGDGSTAAGMGHVVVMDDSPAQFSLTAYSRSLWSELGEEAGESWEDDANGTLWVAATEDELKLVDLKADFYRRRDVAVEVVSGDELADLEPLLRPGLAGALRVPGDRVVYPPLAARWLLQRAVELGAEARLGESVESIGDRCVQTGAGRFDADVVINAAGAAAGRLTPGLPIEPRKGHLVITERYPGLCTHQLVELGYLKSAHTMTTESVAFNVQPRTTGQLLIGSSRELVGWESRINRHILAAMLARAIEFLPRVGDLQVVRSWIGFRPATPDKLPLIGRWPAVEGLWVAAGHEGLGITTSLATGMLLAAMIQDIDPPIDAAPFLPRRFSESFGT
ncbi:MAG: FAD-dependent oxidoreductase [Acidobacteriota bacterium]